MSRPKLPPRDGTRLLRMRQARAREAEARRSRDVVCPTCDQPLKRRECDTCP